MFEYSMKLGFKCLIFRLLFFYFYKILIIKKFIKMKKLLVCFLASTGIFITGCSKEDEKNKNDLGFQLTEQEYREKVTEMKGILKKYGGVEDTNHPYDFYKPENRLHIEKLDLKELENFFIELHSPEGLKNVEDEFTIEKVEPNESPTKMQ